MENHFFFNGLSVRLCYVDTLDGWLRWQVRNGMPLSSPPACAIEMARAAESIYQETKNKE